MLPHTSPCFVCLSVLHTLAYIDTIAIALIDIVNTKTKWNTKEQQIPHIFCAVKLCLDKEK